MCRSAYIGEECFETIGELEAKIGPLIMMDDDTKYAPFACLCNVDMQATAKRHGYDLTVDPCDYYLTKNPT